MKQSFLANERIYLRAVEPEDLDLMYEMENSILKDRKVTCLPINSCG